MRLLYHQGQPPASDTAAFPSASPGQDCSDAVLQDWRFWSRLCESERADVPRKSGSLPLQDWVRQQTARELDQYPRGLLVVMLTSCRHARLVRQAGAAVTAVLECDDPVVSSDSGQKSLRWAMASPKTGSNRNSAYMRVENPPTIQIDVLNRATFTTCQVRCDNPHMGMTAPHEREDAFLVALQLDKLGEQHLTRNGRTVETHHLEVGNVGIYDLKDEWEADIQSPFHVLHFHVTRSSLDALADTYNSKPVDTLDCDPGRGRPDAIVQQLGALLLPAMAATPLPTELFTGHLLLALHEHIAMVYGGFVPAAVALRGKLAPWQEKRAMDFIQDHLSQDISLEQIAAECKLSASHFAKSFRRTTGFSPHRWLIQQRVNEAMRLIRETSWPLASIALACGFGDQSHLTRMFSAQVGQSPAQWRRLHATAQVLASAR